MSEWANIMSEYNPEDEYVKCTAEYLGLTRTPSNLIR